MNLNKYILFFFLLSGINGFSQTDQSPFRIWRLTSFSGQANIKGNYRESESTIDHVISKQTETYLNGILQVRTQSYFVHPNFMLVNLNGIYNPETRRNKYVGVPDYTDKNNSQGLDATATFFRKKNFNLTVNASTYTSIQYIEYLTRIEDKNKYVGGILSYFNPVLPFTLAYSRQKTEQKTIHVDRSFNLDQQIYQATANKSFSTNDNHSLSYLHTENTSIQKDLGYISPLRSFNTIDFVELSDNITLGSKKNYAFSSSIANSEERGSMNNKTFSVFENLTIKLPEQFILSGNYNYRKTRQEFNNINYQRFQGTLSHQLFESLNSRLLFEHWQTDQHTYREQRERAGMDLKYLKKIPGGKLLLSYAYFKEHQSVKSPPTSLKVLHEEYILTDNQLTFLKNQYVDMQSVVVKDVTGNTIYQLNLDYILIDKNPYIEIIRVPGGMIANNASVYLDYTALKPGLFESDMNNHNFNADVWLLNNKLNIYYRLNTQNYSSLVRTENQQFNIFSRHITGARLDFKLINGGVEYEYCQSNILPYHGMKYFLAFQKMYAKLNFSFNGSLTDFQMTNENLRRKDIVVRCKVAYSVFRNLKMDFDYMYISIKGRGIDLDIQTSKIEITTNFYRLFLSLGNEFYWSRSQSANTNYRGVYIQLTRNF